MIERAKFLEVWERITLFMCEHRALLLVLCIAFFARILVIAVVYHDYEIAADAWHWHSMAVNFLNGRGLVVADEIVPYRTPLPALYLATVYALFGGSVLSAQISNAVVGTLTIFLVYDLVRRALDVRAARWSALLSALYPLILLYTGQLISETVFLFLMSLALWLAWTSMGRSPWRWMWLGLILGLAVLTRQTALAIGMMMVGWVFFYGGERVFVKRLWLAGLVLSIMLLTVSVWMARNYWISGNFTLTAQGGDSLWIANNPLSDGTEGDTSHPAAYRIPKFDALPEIERGAAYQNAAITWIQENPERFLSLIPRRVIWFWHITFHPQNNFVSELAFLVIYYPILGLAIFGAIKIFKIKRELLFLLLTIPIALTMVHAIYLPAGRYRLPVELVLCILAGIGLPSVIAWYTERLKQIKKSKFMNINNQLKVAFIAGTLGLGGAEKQLYYMARALFDAGVDVRIYTIVAGEYYEAKLNEKNIPVIWFGENSNPVFRLFLLLYYIYKFQPHIVQSTHFFTNLYAIFAAKLVGAVELGAIRSSTKLALKSVGFLGMVSLKWPKNLIANSRASYKEAITLGVSKNQIRIMPNVIDLKEFDKSLVEKSHKSNADTVVIAQVANCFPVKRIDRFLTALALAKRQFPELVGWIIGDGPDMKSLVVQAKALGLKPNRDIIFWGQRSDIPSLLAKSDILCLTSDSEGFPNVIIEGMAAKLPVISYPVGDIDEIISHGKSGYIAQSEDEMASYLLELSNISSQRKLFGKTGREIVENYYSYDTLLYNLLRIYSYAAEQQNRNAAIFIKDSLVLGEK